MRFFDAGPEAFGFIAVGQVATGFIAIGQSATGVIAIGQIARGGIAIGQASVGLIAVGMGAIGVFHATAMIGIGGRKGWGGVLPLIPTLTRPHAPPSTTTLAAVSAGHGAGWIRAMLTKDGAGAGLFEGGRRLPIKIDHRLAPRAAEASAKGEVRVYASTSRVEGRLVCDRLLYVPGRRQPKSLFLLVSALRLVALAGVAAAFWSIAGNSVLAGLRDEEPRPKGGVATPPARPTTAPPHATPPRTTSPPRTR